MRTHLVPLLLLSTAASGVACSTPVEELGADILNLHALPPSACSFGGQPSPPSDPSTQSAEFQASFKLQWQEALIERLRSGVRLGTVPILSVRRGLTGGDAGPVDGVASPGVAGPVGPSPTSSLTWATAELLVTPVVLRPDALELEVAIVCDDSSCAGTELHGRALATPERSTLELGGDVLTWSDTFVSLRERSGLRSVVRGCDPETGDRFFGRIVAEAGPGGEPQLRSELVCVDAAGTDIPCAGVDIPGGI